MEISAEHVSCRVRDGVPPKGVTICELIPMSSMYSPNFLNDTKEVRIYKRPVEDCPFGRGNWCIDIIIRGGGICCFKLPLEMKETEVFAYAKPLTDVLEEKKKRDKESMN